ncbi:PIN domain-like protein, partial [Mycena maculata]
SGETPDLAHCVDKLCTLLRFSIVATFVFDGPNGPDFKRGKAVNKRPHGPHPLTGEFQSLSKAFGFHCHTALGEAAAELAYLNRLQLVDLILADNEEILVLGATHLVYRCGSPRVWNHMLTCYSLEEDMASIYTSEAIEREAHLSFGGLLLMAVLIGGDYNVIGLPGCTENVAYSLAQRGLGDSLLVAAQNLGPTELRGFLTVWRDTLEMALTEHGRGLVVAQVPETFPDPRILDLYVRPLTSWSHGRPGPSVSEWNPRMLDIVSISRLCEDLCPWGTATALPNRLINCLLPGLCVKRLAQVPISLGPQN